MVEPFTIGRAILVILVTAATGYFYRVRWRRALEPGPDSVSALVSHSRQHDTRGLSELLGEHARTVTSERVSLSEIAAFLGTRSIGAWLLILALPMVLPVPSPGISVLFGVPLMIVSLQLALGGTQAWLPAVILRQSMARADYVRR